MKRRFRLYQLLSGLALLLVAGSAAAQRIFNIDVNGISILGTSSVGAYCVLFTDAGPPVATKSCASTTIPQGSTPDAAAAAIEAGVNACLPAPGVISVSRSGFMVDVTIESDADAFGYECATVPDHTITTSLVGIYTGGFSKGTASVTTSKIVVPPGNRLCRVINWSVTNTSGSAFPVGAEVTWQRSNLTHCAGQLTTNGAAGSLGVGMTVGPFPIGLKITSNIPGKVERGRAFPRPNFDPPFDDPQLDDFELEEGPGGAGDMVPKVPSLGTRGIAILVAALIGSVLGLRGLRAQRTAISERS